MHIYVLPTFTNQLYILKSKDVYENMQYGNVYADMAIRVNEVALRSADFTSVPSFIQHYYVNLGTCAVRIMSKQHNPFLTGINCYHGG